MSNSEGRSSPSIHSYALNICDVKCLNEFRKEFDNNNLFIKFDNKRFSMQRHSSFVQKRNWSQRIAAMAFNVQTIYNSYVYVYVYVHCILYGPGSARALSADYIIYFIHTYIYSIYSYDDCAFIRLSPNCIFSRIELEKQINYVNCFSLSLVVYLCFSSLRSFEYIQPIILCAINIDM